jgi:hypothetical protein
VDLLPEVPLWTLTGWKAPTRNDVVVKNLIVKNLSFRRTLLLFLAAALTITLLGANTPAAMAQSSSIGAGGCPGPASALVGVYDPQRLTVLNPCQTVSGTVEQILTNVDGDYHINLKPDPGYETLLSAANQGQLVTEIMPRDLGRLPVPKVGDHLTLVGVHVIDQAHGWNEIHPIWSEKWDNGPIYTSGP